jgi:Fur family ferric uptake transcriptional regulator
VLAELLDAGHDHIGVEELATRVRRRTPAIHLSTVYRTVDALRESGILRAARLGDQPVAYHLAGDTHHHAVCRSCGATVEFPDTDLDDLRDRLADRHGFAADPEHLTVSGRCRRCVGRGVDSSRTASGHHR